MKTENEVLEEIEKKYDLNFHYLERGFILEAMKIHSDQFRKKEKKTIEERKSEFHFKLSCYAELDKTSLEFFEYWTEHGENDKKMRFEKEKSFDIKKRLERWNRNQKTFNNGNKQQSTYEKHEQAFNALFGSGSPFQISSEG